MKILLGIGVKIIYQKNTFQNSLFTSYTHSNQSNLISTLY